jgi:5-(aminomethyl)-3-furanmethanol phosphate kinase
MNRGRAGRDLTVVKLGGSFALSPYLWDIVIEISAARGHVVIVPGGGPFADAVRDTQRRIGFDDGAAHKMALMAMAQFAEALASLAPRLRPALNLAAIAAHLDAGDVPIWSPWPLADGLEALPQGWQLTSDSLAAWLAGRLGARRLIMIKHGNPPDSLLEAAEAAIVDPLFPAYAEASGAAIGWIDPSQPGALRDILGAESRERLSA